MTKQDLTGYSERELVDIVYNDETLYKMRVRQPYLKATLDEFFIYTDEQMRELMEDLASEVDC